MDCAKRNTRRGEKHLGFGIWYSLYKRCDGYPLHSAIPPDNDVSSWKKIWQYAFPFIFGIIPCGLRFKTVPDGILYNRHLLSSFIHGNYCDRNASLYLHLILFLNIYMEHMDLLIWHHSNNNGCWWWHIEPVNQKSCFCNLLCDKGHISNISKQIAFKFYCQFYLTKSDFIHES